MTFMVAFPYRGQRQDERAPPAQGVVLPGAVRPAVPAAPHRGVPPGQGDHIFAVQGRGYETEQPLLQQTGENELGPSFTREGSCVLHGCRFLFGCISSSPAT